MAIKIIAQDPGILTNLGGVAFANCCDGVAVGANGTVITTNDGGVSWSAQVSDFKEDLHDVAFAGETIIAVGEECTILISSDGGTTWSVATTLPPLSNLPSRLASVDFKDEMGYAVGIFENKALVLTTTDGGKTWSSPQFPISKSADSFGDVAFSIVDGVTYVLVVGLGSGIGGLIIRAEIDTANWSIMPSQTTNELFSVAFAKAPYAQHGWAVGREGTIVHTTDGGATWTAQTSGLPDEILLRVAAIDDKQAWVVGINGSLIATNDGGESWVQQNKESGQQLLDLAFCSPCLGTIVGVSGTVLTLLGHA